MASNSTRAAGSEDDPSLEIELDTVEPTPQSLPPSVQPVGELGGYELLGRIAMGGMAEIFLARQHGHAGGMRQLVVKVVRPQLSGDDDFETMFVNEGRVLMRLKHPNICHVYEVGLDRGRGFIAMEYVNGVTLGQLIRRVCESGESIPAPIMAKIAAQIAEALASAHQATDSRGKHLGIVHRDVSPHNIMLSFNGMVKLLDFGVASVRATAVEESGTIKGKFGYLAPEQCEGRPLDGRADLFSLGVCLWEGLTGRRLYKRDGEYETLRAIVKDPLPDLDMLDEPLDAELEQILNRALTKAPDDRYETGTDMQEALEQYLTDKRELVNAGRIGRFVRGHFAEEVLIGPKLDQRPEIAAWLGAKDPSVPPPPQHAPPTTGDRVKPRRLRVAVGVLAAVAASAVAVAAWAMSSPPEAALDPAPPPAQVAGELESEPAPPPPAPEPLEQLVLEAPPAAPPVVVAEPRVDEPEAEPRRRRRVRPAAGDFVDDPGF